MNEGEIVAAIENLAEEVKKTSTADFSLIAMDLMKHLESISDSLFRIATALELQQES